ncbi:class I SAM-dependent methyltransferase [Dyadobacter psychrotolerans]|uniref:Class I SAM-dependent methyltransferase n=1 Tax=Dyadobacter psychrotolerans TaxID=2541721 RepID=A0A4R5DAP4_9BACT|nr:class I SAM-dependent methyltransferase [Dyadobacter psychrotolerans]TDE08861.1 class I SAM-dependent methyltransferase [Dyadobacter psychrotolerans]
MPLETLKNCPVCHASSFSNYLNVEDYTVSHKEFTIQQCNSCYFLFTNPRPSADEIGAYYQSEEYISHHDESKSLMSKVYKAVRKYTIDSKVKMINELKQRKGSLLDIGCGTGTFIHACKLNGWKISATEPDPGARSVASERVESVIYDSINSPELTGKTFDIITMWHVLEHVHLLNETVEWLRKHLNENGTIIIAVPNPQSFDAAKYSHFWAAYDVPRHLYHFTRNTMKKLMDKHNLQVIKVLPMWFDSFYVGMLSTKYKSKSINLFDSVKTGLLSNLKGRSAKSDGTNTSSLIYIINKK